MQDAVRSLVLSSLGTFKDAIRSACHAIPSVHSTARVEIDRSGSAAGAREIARLMPLFAVSLTADATTNTIGYATDVDSFPERIAGIVLRGVKAAQGIVQLEPLVMTKLHWSYKPPLHAVHLQEPAVTDTLAEIRALVSAAVVDPLDIYCKQFGKYEAVLKRNNEAAVAALLAKGAELTLAEVQSELSTAEAQLAVMQRDVPASVRSHCGPSCRLTGSAVRSCMACRERSKLVACNLGFVPWTRQEANVHHA